MKIVTAVFAVACAALAGCAAPSSSAAGGKAYALQVHQFEGCECESICPCVFSKDTSHGDCRGLMIWQVKSGQANGVDLAGVNLAAALTKSGANMEKAMGQWTGIIYVSDKASEAQKNAVVGVMKAEMGPAFAKVEVKSVPIDIKQTGDVHELSVGKLGTLKIKGIKGANGQILQLENLPSPIAPPKVWAATSEVNLYDDGTTKWDFKGRNAFYTDMDVRSKQ